jgi:hypothetical protein
VNLTTHATRLLGSARFGIIVIFVAAQALLPASASASERLYFVTYNCQMEERGDLDINTEPVFGRARGINSFLSALTEFEYGTAAWWTTEFYLNWQHTFNDSSAFTGVRLENRFRPLQRDHRVNVVLYVEYEHLSDADKTLKEVVGFDGKADFSAPNAEVRHDFNHELDTKLILSSRVKGWDVAENFIAEKNLSGGPWEFGYAVGVSRPLASSPAGGHCAFCKRSLIVGAELYGGLGTGEDFTLKGTSHYLAPIVGWQLGPQTLLRVSPTWGLTDDSVGTLVRFGISQEIEGVGRALGKLVGH